MRFKHISKIEALKEVSAKRIYQRALTINRQLNEFKAYIIDLCQKIHDDYMEEVGNDTPKNTNTFSWYNFDSSVKIQVSVNHRIEFDDLGIAASKGKLDTFLDSNLSSEKEFIKELVLDAFSTTRGNLDAKKLMSLLKYKSKIKDPLFSEAINLLEDSIRTPDSKMYFRVYAKNTEGKYEAINLNFSSI